MVCANSSVISTHINFDNVMEYKSTSFYKLLIKVKKLYHMGCFLLVNNNKKQPTNVSSKIGYVLFCVMSVHHIRCDVIIINVVTRSVFAIDNLI